MDSAEANQWVFYGTAITLALAFICSLFHPGTAGDGHAGAGAARRERRAVTAATARCRTPVARCFQVPNNPHPSSR